METPENKDSAETPASKLRNLLSPAYGLADIVLALETRPDMLPLALESARLAKSTQTDIHAVLKQIDELCK